MRYRRGPGPVGHFQKRSVLMSMAEPESPPRPTSSAAFDALSFQAPYVVERLVKSRVVDSPAEAEKLFTEVKRYLVLCAISPGLDIGMHSAFFTLPSTRNSASGTSAGTSGTLRLMNLASSRTSVDVARN
jgi:hypothetical protein